MTAGSEIRALLAGYCDLIDAGGFDGLGELFREGRLANEAGRVFASGADEVAAYFRDHVLLYYGTPQTKHLVLNTVIEQVATDVLAARSSYLVLQALDGGPLQPIATGRYIDTFRREGEGAWRFDERRYAIDLTGDLSRHLRS